MHVILQLIVLVCLGCGVLASPQQELLQQQPTAVIQPATPLNDTAIPLNAAVRPLPATVAANSAQAARFNSSSVTKAAGTAAASGAAAGLERAGPSLPATVPATVVAAQPAATQNPTGSEPSASAQTQATSGIPGQHLPASAAAQTTATAQPAGPSASAVPPVAAAKQPAQASKRPKEPDYAVAFVEPTLAGAADVDVSTVPGQQGLSGTAIVLHAAKQNGTRAATADPATATVGSLLARAKAAAAAAAAKARAGVQHITRPPGINVSAVQAERGARPGKGALGRNATQLNSTAAVQVTLLHFNDWHVRVESTKGSWCGLCTEYDVKKGRCSGGLARMATFIKQQRLLDPDLLLLNAGDDFIGTEWDRKAGLDAPAAFMNMLEVDAMTIGNHEWDKGLDSLKQYLDKNNNKAVLGANIDFQGHDLKNKVKPYVIKEVKGKKVCILGLTTMYGLPGSSQMGAVKIQEPYGAGRRVLEELKGKGCHAKVLLSHLGYTSDLVAASVIPGLDLIIGGHSHSFLWPDPDSPPAFYTPGNNEDGNCCSKQSGPEYDVTWGPYPTYVHSNGKQVPVVQASWGSRYMGKLLLRFKPQKEGGKLDGIEGEIVLLGGPNSEQHVPEDEAALAEIKKWRHW